MARAVPPTGGWRGVYLQLLEEERMVPAVQELRPELDRARRDPSQVTHAPAHGISGLYDHNAPLRPRP